MNECQHDRYNSRADCPECFGTPSHAVATLREMRGRLIELHGDLDYNTDESSAVSSVITHIRRELEWVEGKR